MVVPTSSLTRGISLSMYASKAALNRLCWKLNDEHEVANEADGEMQTSGCRSIKPA